MRMLLLASLLLASVTASADPRVLLGGYQPTFPGSPNQILVAYPQWDGAPGTIDITYEGIPTGLSLRGVGGLYQYPMPQGLGAGEWLLGLTPSEGTTTGPAWPYLHVKDTPPDGCLRQVNQDGFGRPKNFYSWAMTTFKGQLYVGTLNGNAGLPTFGLTNTVFDPDGTEIWRYDGQSWEIVAERGFRNHPDAFGTRNLIEHDGKLYAGTAALQDGCEIWESADGLNWRPIMTGGFGKVTNQSVRGMYSHDGILYVGIENASDGAELWAWDGTNWTNLMEGGFGNISNRSIAKILFWRDRLWLMLWNFVGYEIYTYDIDTGTFEKRVGSGAPVGPGNGDALNQGVLSAAIYNDRLYIGTVNVFNGADIYRTDDGRSWTQIADDGIDYRKQAYVWRMKEYRGQLYIGCYTLGTGQTTFQEAGRLYVMNANEEIRQLIGPQGTLAPAGIVGNINYGFRTLEVFQDRLFLGTAQCFFCDIRRPGTQVWELDLDCR